MPRTRSKLTRVSGEVTFNWLETSHVGPQFGWLRALAEAAGRALNTGQSPPVSMDAPPHPPEDNDGQPV